MRRLVICLSVVPAALALIVMIFLMSNYKRVNTEEEKEFEVFGAYDDRTFTEEIELNWDKDDFKSIKCKLDKDTQEFVYQLCKGYNIDFTLIMAQIKQESDFNPKLISGTNDYGLMQINKCNHKWIKEKLDVDDFLDAKQNVRAGIFVMRKLFEKYKEPNMVLMAYNMGEAGAKSLWNEGIYQTYYSKQILKYQKEMKR